MVDYATCKEKLISHIQNLFAEDSSGHDYFHSIRVYNTAMKIAEKRQAFMEQYLKEFYAEWNGEC